MLTIRLSNASFDESKDNISYFMKGDFFLGEITGKRAVWGTGEKNSIIKLRKISETQQELYLDLFRRTRPEDGAQRIWFGLVAFLQTIKLTSDSTSAMDWEHIPLDDELHAIINEALPDETDWKKNWRAASPTPVADDAAENAWQIILGSAHQRQSQALREIIARLERFLLTPKDAAAQWLAEDTEANQATAQSSDPIPTNALPLVKDPTDQKILEWVTQEPKLGDKDLAQRLGISRQAVNPRRRALEKMGYKVR